MDSHKTAYVFLLMTIAAFSSQKIMCQQTDDDFKKELLKSLNNSQFNSGKDSRYNLQDIEKSDGNVLKVGPMTKLPTRFDRIQMFKPTEHDKPVKINMTITNNEIGYINRMNDYSVKKVYAAPDARSIYQWINYTRGDGGAVITTPGFDADPVRAYQMRKQAKRQKKIDKIKRVYGQDD